ncbi:MAG: transcription elongation factor GreA [Candidatus Paceibacterota bacterium]
MADEKEYLTPEKYKEVQDELEYLRTRRRKEVADQLEYAKSLGDLSENAEYQEARDLQAKVEEQIAHYEHLLKNAEVVSTHGTDSVTVGSHVVIQQKEKGTTQEFTIVGTEEADTASGKISVKSPIGEAIFGKKKGDEVKAETPGGTKTYVVKDIK